MRILQEQIIYRYHGSCKNGHYVRRQHMVVLPIPVRVRWQQRAEIMLLLLRIVCLRCVVWGWWVASILWLWDRTTPSVATGAWDSLVSL